MADLKAERAEFKARTFSSVLIAVIIIGSIYYGGYVWTLTAAVIALLSLNEYYRLIAHIQGVRLSTGIGYIFSLIFFLAAVKENPQPIVLAMILTLCVFAVFVVEIFKRQISQGKSGAILNAGGIVSGVLYISVPWTCMIMLRNYFAGYQVLIMLFFCTWACDVGAYLGGKAFGKTRLCVHVSPGKTIQGFFFGAIASVITNAILIYFFSLPPYPLIFVGFICGVAGQVGDLAESLIKRETNQKDSGKIIPGHGGMLDRFDSILFNGLLTYFILRVLL